MIQLPQNISELLVLGNACNLISNMRPFDLLNSLTQILYSFNIAMPLTFQNLPRHCPVVIIHIQLFESKGNFWRNRLQLLLYLCKMFPKGSIIATAGQGAINNITEQGPRCSKRNVTQHLN